VRLRDATAEDAAAVAALEREVFGDTAWSPASVASTLAAPGALGVVARAPDGTDVGYALAHVAGDVADLDRIAVAEAWRRRDVGGALLAAVRRRVAGLADRLLLEVAETNAPALAFYRRAGFAEIARRRRYYPDGSDALVLGLDLTTPERRPRS
jgi:ribosomal-protein-alanine N-acetyltransferase